jgi:hypothetical protein
MSYARLRLSQYILLIPQSAIPSVSSLAVLALRGKAYDTGERGAAKNL